MNFCAKKNRFGYNAIFFRESSFNMTRGGDEDIDGGLRKFLDTRKGGSEKIRGGGGFRKFVYFKPKRRGGLLKKLNR